MGLSKVRARWAPRFLTPVQKSFRVETCSEMLAIYSATPDNVLSRIITGDETWIHHWDPGTIQESTQWKHVNSAPPRNFRTQPSAGKSWPQFSGIAKACCWWITYHGRQQWLDPTTVKFWQICIRQWRRSKGESWPEVRCCCTIMLRRTCLELHRPQSRTSGLSSCLTHFTHPTWHPATSIPISTYESAPSRNEVFWWWWAVAGHGAVSRQHSPGILFHWNKRTFLTNVKSVLMYREITLKNKFKCFACAICTSYWIAKLFWSPRV